MNARKSYILELHDSIIGTDKSLLNGEVYYPHRKNARNHPFYFEESWIRGSVHTQNTTYKDLLLRYNIVKDQPLLLHISGGARVIALNIQEITGFSLENVSFIYLHREGVFDKKEFASGYYQQVYSGDIQLYARWIKERKKNNGFIPDEFQQDVKLIMVKDGAYHSFNSDKSLRDILLDQKKEIKKFMQENNIHVKFSSPEQIGTVIRYYEHLISMGS
jgi:hypothetical protein